MGDQYRIEHVTGGAVAQGPDAHATYYEGSASEIRKLVEDLRAEIERHSKEFADPAEVRGSANLLEKELQDERPNFAGVGALLKSIVSSAGNVASVVEAVNRIQHAIASFV